MKKLERCPGRQNMGRMQRPKIKSEDTYEKLKKSINYEKIQYTHICKRLDCWVNHVGKQSGCLS
jgi:hypothetical protein